MLRDELEQGTASQLVLWVDANPPWVSRALGALGVLGALGAAKHWEEFAATPANPGFWRHTRPTRVPEWLLTVFPHSSRSAHSDTPEPGQKSWCLQKKKKKVSLHLYLLFDSKLSDFHSPPPLRIPPLLRRRSFVFIWNHPTSQKAYLPLILLSGKLFFRRKQKEIKRHGGIKQSRGTEAPISGGKQRRRSRQASGGAAKSGYRMMGIYLRAK